MPDAYAEHWTQVAAELDAEGLAGFALEFSKPGAEPWQRELAEYLRRALAARLSGRMAPLSFTRGGKS
jgi:hypothetical protein